MAFWPCGDRADLGAQSLDLGYAKQNGASWINYTPALGAATGGMTTGMAMDGVHPTAEARAVMERVLGPVVRRFDVV
ncbi:hypothetical protein EAH79_07710 [Sphingomonas koreensis]|nr:hypothetical protein EAH79_07710 [Sphingomonas koreensis]